MFQFAPMKEIVGTTRPESLIGTAGADHISALGGDDTLMGVPARTCSTAVRAATVRAMRARRLASPSTWQLAPARAVMPRATP